jgi:hypothetical protein
MSCVIPFPTPRPTVDATLSGPADVPRLAARLQRLERATSSDEGLQERLVDSELATLDALAAARARDHAEVALKLAVLLRRVEATGDDSLSQGELALLRGALRDLRRLGRGAVAAQA